MNNTKGGVFDSITRPKTMMKKRVKHSSRLSAYKQEMQF